MGFMQGLLLVFMRICTLRVWLGINPRQWPQTSARGTWLGTVRTWLKDLKWREAGGWKWTHPDINFTLDWNVPISEDLKGKEHHSLRESWRRQQFHSFATSSRRDAVAVQGSAYSESRCKLVRQVYQTSGTHMRAVLIGAVVSDARYERIFAPNAPPGPCTWCSSGDVLTWYHMAWQCAAFACTRPQVPGDQLQLILGWPLGQNHSMDCDILSHLSRVRERILDRRYRDI